MQLEVSQIKLSEFCEFCKNGHHGIQDIVTKMMSVKKSSLALKPKAFRSDSE